MTRRITRRDGCWALPAPWAKAATIQAIDGDLHLDFPPDPPRPPVFGADFDGRLNRGLVVTEESS